MRASDVASWMWCDDVRVAIGGKLCLAVPGMYWCDMLVESEEGKRVGA